MEDLHQLRKEITLAIETLTERTFELGGTKVSVKGNTFKSGLSQADIRLDGKPWVAILCGNNYNLAWKVLQEVHKEKNLEFTMEIA